MQDNILPGSPADWMRHAKSDLIYAKYKDENVIINQKCFHCQQSVEKRDAVDLRYPGDFDEITDEEYAIALKLAEQVYAWAEKQIV